MTGKNPDPQTPSPESKTKSPARVANPYRTQDAPKPPMSKWLKGCAIAILVAILVVFIVFGVCVMTFDLNVH